MVICGFGFQSKSSVNSTQGMTSPRRYATFARERDKLAVNFVLYISDIERFSGAHISKHPVRGNHPSVGRVADPDDLGVLALKAGGHNSFGPAKVDVFASGLELLDPFLADRVAHAVVNVFAFQQRDLIMKLARSCFCHGHTFGRRNGQISAS